jgi:hypothetical protein
MKPLLLALLFGSLVIHGQSNPPDCQFSATFTSATTGADFNNKTSAGATPCVKWRVAYFADGMAGVRIQLEGANDANGIAGTYAAIASGQVYEGSNPMTDPAQSTAAMTAYYPWIRLNVTTFTPTGGPPNQIVARVYGYKGTSASAGSGGSGNGITALTDQVLATGPGSVPATLPRIYQTDLSSTAPTIGSEVLTNGNFASGVTGWTVNPSGSWFAAGIQPVAFTGSGLNDATSGGTYTAAVFHTYSVIIDGTGTPDTFKWNVDSGAFTAGVHITGSAQAIGTDGVTIQFAATHGHTLGNQWIIYAAPSGLGVFGINNGELSQTTGSSGNVLVTFTVSAVGHLNTGEGTGPYLEVSDSSTFDTLITAAGTYQFLMAANNIIFGPFGDGWALSSVSALPYSVPYTIPIPPFVSLTDSLNPQPVETRYGFGLLALGYLAGQNNTASDGPSLLTAFGVMAGQNNSGYDLTSTGFQAGQNNSSTDVTATGFQAAQNNSGAGATATGSGTAQYNSGSGVTAMGFAAGQYNRGDSVTALGFEAAQSNSGSTVTAVGTGAAENNSGSTVTALGNGAAAHNTASDYLELDGIDRSNEVGERTQAAIVGHLDSNPLNQSLQLNAALNAQTFEWQSMAQGGCGAYTNAAISGADPTKITSATYTFVQADMGGVVQITAGTGFLTGAYRIVGIPGGGAQLDRAVGTAGSTGGSFSVNVGRAVYVTGGSGVADTLNVCAKNSSNAYAWTPAVISGAPGTWPSFGGAALLNVGTTAGTVAAGNDPRFPFPDRPAWGICYAAGCGSEVPINSYAVLNPNGITFDECGVNLTTAATGSSVIIDVQQWNGSAWVSIFGATKLVVPVSTALTEIFQATFANSPQTAAKGAILRAAVTQNDSGGTAQGALVGCRVH